LGKKIRLAAGFLIFALFLLWAGPESIISTIAGIDTIYLLPVALFFFLSIGLNITNLYLLSNVFSPLEWKKAGSINLMSWAASFFGPGKIGQFSQVYFLKKNGLSVGQATAITVIDKTISILVFAFFGIFAAFLFLGEMAVYVVGSLLLTFLVLGLFLFSGKGRGIIKKYLLGKYSAIFAGFSQSVGEVKEKKLLVSLNLAITTARFICNTAVVFFLLLAVGAGTGFTNLLLINGLTQIISYIPFTISGLGFKEGGFAVMASYIGIEKAAAFGAISLATLIDYLSVAVIVSYYSRKIEWKTGLSKA
jgi:uncharacterized protein (TIRG00374 family)